MMRSAGPRTRREIQRRCPTRRVRRPALQSKAGRNSLQLPALTTVQNSLRQLSPSRSRRAFVPRLAEKALRARCCARRSAGWRDLPRARSSILSLGVRAEERGKSLNWTPASKGVFSTKCSKRFHDQVRAEGKRWGATPSRPLRGAGARGPDRVGFDGGLRDGCCVTRRQKPIHRADADRIV